MTMTTPEHMVRLTWHGDEITLDCQNCPITGRWGYPPLSPVDVTDAMRLQVYRDARLLADSHGYQDNAEPDPTGTARFWDKLKVGR